MPHILLPLLFIVPHVANVLGLRENKEIFDLIFFIENRLHEHELQLSDYNISKYFDPNICISGIIYIFFILTLKSSQAKIVNIFFFYQKFIHLVRQRNAI